MSGLGYIFWNADPEIFALGGLKIRWYGLLFALGFLLGQQIIYKIYKTEGKDLKQVDPLTIYMVIATILGARLGHVLFYGPYFTPDGTGYFDNPLSIFYVWEGGLASHGAAFMILFAAWLFHKKYKTRYLWVLDRVVIVIALAGCFIRFGNLMNSEIIGKSTSSSIGFVFAKNIDHYYNYSNDAVKSISVENLNNDTVVDNQVYAKTKLTFSFHEQDLIDDDIKAYLRGSFIQNVKAKAIENRYLAALDQNYNIKVYKENEASLATMNLWAIPRHPAQLYESMSNLLAFVILFILYIRAKGNIAEGRLFGIFCVVVFTLRFFYEYLKENQSSFAESFEQAPPLNMGQILSIPLVLVGIFVLVRSFRKKTNETTSTTSES